MTDTMTIHTLSAERLQELLQSMGYRVTVSERAGQLQLLSAAQGIGFLVRPGNRAKGESEFVDYTLSCALRVQGRLPAGLTDAWNIGKRFARLTRQGEFLVLEQDVIVAGGVSQNYLRATAELWDRLLQEFVRFLREYSSANASSSADRKDGGDVAAADSSAPITDGANDEAGEVSAQFDETAPSKKAQKTGAELTQ